MTDVSKKAQELIVFQESLSLIHASIIFNTVAITRRRYINYLSMYLDEQLSFNDQIKVKNSKLNKSVTIIEKFLNMQFKKLPINYQQILSRSTS